MSEMQLSFDGEEIALADLNRRLAKHPCPICGRLVSNRGGRHQRWHEGSLRWSTTEEQAEIVQLYLMPRATIASVAEQVPWSRSAVRHVLADHGVLRRHGGQHGTITPTDTLLETAQLYGVLKSMDRVADVLGISRSAVHARLRAMGVRSLPKGRPGRRHISAEDCEAVVRLYQQGLSMDEVAARLGYASRQPVARRLRHAGVQGRPRSEATRLSYVRRRAGAASEPLEAP